MYAGCDSRLGADAVRRIPWGYLGQDDTTPTEDISSLGTASLGLPGGILDPSAPPVSVDELQTYVTTGTADPSVIGQLSSLVSAAAPAVQSILQQVQLGQLAPGTPLSSLAQLRSAITGAPVSIGTTLSNITSNPTLLLLGGGLLVLLLSRKRAA